MRSEKPKTNAPEGGDRFPATFIWGTATSAQQIEGGRHTEGRADSIWDHFAASPGNIADGSDPDTACDHYTRWAEDIELMRWLGTNAYRFSTSWSRVMPDGRTPNALGLDFYDRLIDGLLAVGIAPFLTLNHWDIPQALQERGGWPARDTVGAFVDYAAAVSARLGDRVKQWCTHNEPWCVATLGYEEGKHAPGRKNPAEGLRAGHHLLLSHGRGVGVIRDQVPDARVGLVNAYSPAYPASDSEADGDAARWFDGFFNRWYLDPVFKGSYPADAVADRVARGQLTEDIPFVKDGDLAVISAPLDYLGVNYYSRVVMKTGPDGQPVAVPGAPKEELTEMGWEVFPAGLSRSLVRLHEDYAPPRLYITENGAAFPDPPVQDGRIADTRRRDYLRDHLAAARAAIDAGVPLRGYFAWSLLDNFEWGDGFTRKFGLFRTDFDTLERTPKDSAFYYRDVISRNEVATA
jgi:beta-glucosidase